MPLNETSAPGGLDLNGTSKSPLAGAAGAGIGAGTATSVSFSSTASIVTCPPAATAIVRFHLLNPGLAISTSCSPARAAE
jgi:hypothetical protein